MRITSVIRNPNGSVVLTWAAIGGSRYRVHYSDAGADGGFTGVFTALARSVNQEMNAAPLGMTVNQSFTDDFSLTGGPPANGARYYRIEVVR